MFIKKNKINILTYTIDKLINTLEKSNIAELSYILGNKKEIVKRNLLAGISRGIGIGIGVTVITATLIIVLNKIVKLNIPIIGEYIADIVEIVQKSRWKWITKKRNYIILKLPRKRLNVAISEVRIGATYRINLF